MSGPYADMIIVLVVLCRLVPGKNTICRCEIGNLGDVSTRHQTSGISRKAQSWEEAQRHMPHHSRRSLRCWHLDLGLHFQDCEGGVRFCGFSLPDLCLVGGPSQLVQITDSVTFRSNHSKGQLACLQAQLNTLHVVSSFKA